MPPTAHIKHSIQGRTRIQVPSKLHDHRYFDEIRHKLLQLDGVRSVQTNPVTGSVLVKHDCDAASIGQYAEHHGLFAITAAAEAALALSRKISDKMDSIDDQVLEMTKGNLDLKSIMVLALGSAAAIQIFRKDVFPPAFNLVWYGLALIWPKQTSPGQ